MRRLSAGWIALGLLAAVLPFPLSPDAGQTRISAPEYTFVVETFWITMPDGIRLAATVFRPQPKIGGERFPVLFEFLPYRKDDSFYMRDYPLYAYFARRGYAAVKVDIRGTGSSEGRLPPWEYSEQELEDAVEVIAQLARMDWSSGNVGMWGISWGGFNALMTARRRPPALKAVLAVHASDDLYHDDVHYLDGVFHIDEYILIIDHENGLPATPDYRLDGAYFKNRFEATPWFITYLKQQRDGPFWRKESLRWQYDKLKVPTYLIGGLLDGYRDTVPRILENVGAPVKGVIGPWNHAWPDNGEPGPNYEWRHEAVRWWDHWLKGRDTGVLDDPQFTFFLRTGHGPDPNLKQTPGRWVCDTWPPERGSRKRFHPGSDGDLAERPGEPSTRSLHYVPSYGLATGVWWGETTGDLRPDDAGSLVFDTPVLDETIEIAGFPRVRLRVGADAPLAHWVARLEDVQPDGTVALVTGGLINGSQRQSRLNPVALEPGKLYDLEFDLHFTTWTFRPGHRIRLAVSNALFPMIWPSPHPMLTRLVTGDASWLDLPVLPTGKRNPPSFVPPQPRESREDARYLRGEGWPRGDFVQVKDVWRETTGVSWQTESEYEVRGVRYLVNERLYFETRDSDPARSRYRGEARHRIFLPEREIDLRTHVVLDSTADDFKVVFIRRIFENGRQVRERTWRETIPRVFQ